MIIYELDYCYVITYCVEWFDDVRANDVSDIPAPADGEVENLESRRRTLPVVSSVVMAMRRLSSRPQIINQSLTSPLSPPLTPVSRSSASSKMSFVTYLLGGNVLSIRRRKVNVGKNVGETCHSLRLL